ncbi:MAG: Usg family protein [Parcubacteria group bacterium]|nr:Usg family protein [Parcubacteria group bacterium]
MPVRYQLVTAEIAYYMPDHPLVLQLYIWQKLDMLPELRELYKFLEFWEKNIDGPLHSVRVACAPIVSPRELRYFNYEIKIS